MTTFKYTTQPGQTLEAATQAAVSALSAEGQNEGLFDFWGLAVGYSAQESPSVLREKVLQELERVANDYDKLEDKKKSVGRQYAFPEDVPLQGACVRAVLRALQYGNAARGAMGKRFANIRFLFSYGKNHVWFNPWRPGEVNRMIKDVKAVL